MQRAELITRARALIALVDFPTAPAQARILGLTLLALSPIMLLSLVLPDRAEVIVVLVTSWVIVEPLTRGFQEDLFRLPLKSTHLLVAAPFVLVNAFWAIFLLWLDRRSQLGATVLPALILGLTALAPLYRSNKSTRTERRFPYRWTYIAAAVVVFLLQIAVLWDLS